MGGDSTRTLHMRLTIGHVFCWSNLEYDAGHCYVDFLSGAINVGNFLFGIIGSIFENVTDNAGSCKN